MKYILVKREKTYEGNKIDFRVTDILDPVADKEYIQNFKIPSLGLSFTCFLADDPKDLFDNPVLYQALIARLS